MIPVREALEAISRRREDGVVVSNSAALQIWPSVSTRRDLDVDLHDCADKACLVGLGLSLSQRRRNVLVLDSDAALRASLGSLVTIGDSAPKNLVHFLFEQVPQAHSRTPNIDYQALSRLGGYSKTFEFSDLEELVIRLPDVLDETGPTFVALKVAHEPNTPEPPTGTMSESFTAVKKTLEGESVSPSDAW